MAKVLAGQRFAISASTFNTLVDAAEDAKRRQLAALSPGLAQVHTPGHVLIENASGAARAQFDVLGVADVPIRPADNLVEFTRRFLLQGVTPTASHSGRFAVLLEPLAKNRIGRAVVAGPAFVHVKMNNETDGAADVLAGDAAKLSSCLSGSATLLWVEPVADRTDPQIAWAIARLGGGGGGGGSVAVWAQVTAVAESSFSARLLDATGNMTGDELNVQVAAAGPTSVRFNAVLAQELPWIAVGGEVLIEYRSGYRTGWWLAPHNVTSCEFTGG